ncbi:methyltransferase domain-containing protein [Flavobacteriaceae bacterium]|nr:methyltransferase domain-containing protein [Flavobacteriaceae bacterium]
MTHSLTSKPKEYEAILNVSNELNFSMISDEEVGVLLRLLTSSKKEGEILELVAGTGLALAWILDGLHPRGKIISIENDPQFVKVARSFFDKESRIKILQEDAEVWIEKNKHRQFDLIFADTWAGKFTHLNQTLQMVKPGGFYIIDDLNRQENWPEGHQDKVIFLMEELKCQTSFSALPIDFGTGIMVLCRKFD